MSKLDICLTELALTITLYTTGGMSMPPKQPPKKRQLDDLACVFPNAAGLDIGSAEIVCKLQTLYVNRAKCTIS